MNINTAVLLKAATDGMSVSDFLQRLMDEQPDTTANGIMRQHVLRDETDNVDPKADPNRPAARHRRRIQNRIGMRKQYRAIGRKRPNLADAYMKVYDVVVAAGKTGIQSFDVTAKLAKKHGDWRHKTTESALHNLRVEGAVESFVPRGK